MKSTAAISAIYRRMNCASIYGVVPQDTVLFANTVYENLSMASPHAGFDDVISACRMAEIHEVIEKMPQGYQTRIGEHGVGLSGGKKQRIAIARAAQAPENTDF